MLDKFFKKESPILGLLGMGGGIARASSGLGPLEITGASVTSYSNSTHTWIVQTASNPITTSRGFIADDEVEIVLVGGGGAGSSNVSGASGGGGGGGVVFVPKSKGPEIITAPGTYPITIGDGGTAGTFGGAASTSGANSQIASVAIPLVARGGGVGGSSGGSGGGGNWISPGSPALQPTENPGVSGINQYGTPGRKGSYPSEPLKGGGGGGAGQGGPTSSSVVGGGDGIPVDPVLPGFMTPSFPTPIINDLGGYPNSSPDFDYFGGGGGGGQRGSGLTPYGLGGGGQGAGNPGPPGTAGKNGRGGGGGGGAEGSGPTSQCASGGSGCFILRFKII
mgnify:CR=1 FL=1